MDEFGVVQARSLARDFSRGFGPLDDFASTGRIASRAALRVEVESCLADMLELRSKFPGDDVIVAEMAQLKRFLGWITRN